MICPVNQIYYHPRFRHSVAFAPQSLQLPAQAVQPLGVSTACLSLAPVILGQLKVF